LTEYQGKGVYDMHDELLRRLNETKTMSIVGMCKNAGKTTMLNWMLTGGHLRGTLGLTSIGRDGESTDVVTGTEKPGIFVKEGTLIATAKDMLRLGDVTNPRPTKGGCSRHGAWSYQLFSAKRARNCLVRSS